MTVALILICVKDWRRLSQTCTTFGSTAIAVWFSIHIIVLVGLVISLFPNGDLLQSLARKEHINRFDIAVGLTSIVWITLMYSVLDGHSYREGTVSHQLFVQLVVTGALDFIDAAELLTTQYSAGLRSVNLPTSLEDVILAMGSLAMLVRLVFFIMAILPRDFLGKKTQDVPTFKPSLSETLVEGAGLVHRKLRLLTTRSRPTDMTVDVPTDVRSTNSKEETSLQESFLVSHLQGAVLARSLLIDVPFLGEHVV